MAENKKEITIDGHVYKEMKITNLTVDGVVQTGYVLTADKILGKEKLNVTIITDATQEETSLTE